MRIGDLNKTLELQEPVQTADGMGGMSTEWKTRAIVWGAVWPVSAKEQIQAAQNILSITHKIRVYYYQTLKSSWRIKLEDRYFNIISIINPSERNEVFDLMCKEAI